MARPQKQGLEYYPQDTDIHSDRKIKKLITEQGAIGYLVYDYIKCLCYRYNGYFIVHDEDLAFDIADFLKCGLTEEKVKDIIISCLRFDLFNSSKYQELNILTSSGIQKRYLKAKRNGIIAAEYNVIAVITDDSLQKPIVNASESTQSTQSKVNESKVNESKETPLLQYNEIPIPNITRPSTAPTLQLVKECFMRLGKPIEEAESFFNYYEGLNWYKGNTPIMNWQSFANRWVAGTYQKSAIGTTSAEDNAYLTERKKVIENTRKLTEGK